MITETRFNCRINIKESLLEYHNKKFMFVGNQVFCGSLSNEELIKILSFFQLNYSRRNLYYAGTQLILKEIRDRHKKLQSK